METRIQDRISRQIQQFGPMDMGQYMQICLAHYYATRDPLGAAGDFTTAPEISQTFGEMLGVCLIDAWVRAGAPAVHLVECGPGRGTLMADILRIARAQPDFLQRSTVHLVETSPSLRAVQAKTLKGHSPVWHESIDTLPDDAPLLMVANEFLDALPVRQAVMHNGLWRERVVTQSGGVFGFGVRDLPPALMPDFTAQEGAICEFSPARDAVMLGVAGRIKAQGGLFLTLDYGYDAPRATGDTVQAVFKHAFCGIFEHMGAADLTAHVDFARLRAIAQAQGLQAYGTVSQGDFLKALGIEARAAQLAAAGSQTVQADVMRLTDPAQMGGLFLAMAAGDGRFIPAAF